MRHSASGANPMVTPVEGRAAAVSGLSAQRTVVDLARTHRVLGARIATVLRLDIGDVRCLAKEGCGPFSDAIAIHPASRHDRAGGLASTQAVEP